MQRTTGTRQATEMNGRTRQAGQLAASAILCCLCTAVLLSVILESTFAGDTPDRTATKYLIIHADDAGMSHSVNAGTVDGLENGVVSSASIMVPCPWFIEFAKYAKEHPEGDYGIHLTLNSEWTHYRWGPVASKDKVPSLIDEDGYLWDNVSQVGENVKAEEVEIELRAQIDRALKFGVPLSHLDTHMGAVLARPDITEVYIRLGIEYKLPILFLRKLDEARAKEYPGLRERFQEVVQLLEANHLPVLDELAQFYGGDTHAQRKANYVKMLRELKPGFSQVIIHCGIANEELHHITNSWKRRDGDRRIFKDPEVLEEIDRLGIKVISWKQFRELAAPK